MPVRGYVLIEAEVGRSKSVGESVLKLNHPDAKVVGVDTVTGPYDVIVQMDAAPVAELRHPTRILLSGPTDMLFACQFANGPSSSSTRELTAATCGMVSRPRATPDWLVITATCKPAARNRSSAACAPGIGSTRSGSPL